MIRELYRIERKAKDLGQAQRRELREEQAVPVLDTLEEWIAKHRLAVPPKSPLGKALTYATNQWQALRRYTADGRMEIDNGRCERLLRLLVRIQLARSLRRHMTGLLALDPVIDGLPTSAQASGDLGDLKVVA